MNAGTSSPASPKRRWFLKAALALSVTGAALGGGVWWRRGFDGTALTPDGREVFRALARGVVGHLLPPPGAEREAVLDAHLASMEALINSLPSAKRDQISVLIGMLANSPTRYMTTGMWTSWSAASDDQVREALENLRSADNLVKNTSFAGARGLTCMAFFSMPEQWTRVGYPGPVAI